MRINLSSEFDPKNGHSSEHGLQTVLLRIRQTIERDKLVRQTIDELREMLQVDRVVLYYFYEEWYGQVTFEALSSKKFSILGSTGADQCLALHKCGMNQLNTDISLYFK